MRANTPPPPPPPSIASAPPIYLEHERLEVVHVEKELLRAHLVDPAQAEEGVEVRGEEGLASRGGGDEGSVLEGWADLSSDTITG